MRVVLVAGEPIVRFGLRSVVERCEDIELVAAEADARSGFRAVDAAQPDVVVMDVALAGMSGIAATREVKRRAPRVRVLLLSSWACERDAIEGLAAGADGFALKTEPTDALLGAIRIVGGGQRYMTPALRDSPLEAALASRRALAPRAAEVDMLAVLSTREREVLDLVIKGWRNRDIARELCVSIKTVDTHRTHINRKLGVAGPAGLIRFAADNGLLRNAAAATAAATATATAAADPPARDAGARTIVLLVDDDPGLRRELLRDLGASGQKVQSAQSPPRAPAAAADLYRDLVRDGGATTAPIIVAFDESGGTGPAVRAAASFPRASECEQFFAALERAAAHRDVPNVPGLTALRD